MLRCLVIQDRILVPVKGNLYAKTKTPSSNVCIQLHGNRLGKTHVCVCWSAVGHIVYFTFITSVFDRLWVVM